MKINKELLDLFTIKNFDKITKLEIDISNGGADYTIYNNSIMKFNDRVSLQLVDNIDNQLILRLLKAIIKTATDRKDIATSDKTLLVSNKISNTECKRILNKDNRFKIVKLNIIDDDSKYIIPDSARFGWIVQQDNKYGIICIDSAIKVDSYL